MEAILYRSRWRSDRGLSVIELLVVFAVMGAVVAMAVPNFINARRITRASGVTQEVATQLRLARQEAMSQLRAVTLQYDNAAKQLVVIRHAAAGTGVLTDGNYPNNGVTVRTVPLTGGGLSAADIVYGRPAGVPTVNLADNTTLTVIPTGGRLNITFQPDGSVVNAAGNPVDVALFLYNGQADRDTATAISVLGAAGRVKVWRYNSNANRYVE
jgi:Tfp pilus assembly protein FimT